jgi:hypothetical protein
MDVPPSVEAITRFLSVRGYVPILDDELGTQNFARELFMDRTHIDIRWERYAWSIGAGVSGEDTVFWVVDWENYFNRESLKRSENLTIDQQCHYFQSHIADIEEAIRDDLDLHSTLKQLRHQRIQEEGWIVEYPTTN